MQKVQILLPVYNAAEFLERTLGSLVEQTYKHIEIVILNDASVDQSVEIMEQWQRHDERITLLHNRENQGIIASRNKLFSYATAPFLALADADDLYHPERIEKQLNFLLDNPSHVAVSCNYNMFGCRNSLVNLPATHSDITAYFTLDNVFLNPGAMINKEHLDTAEVWFDDDYKGASDYLFWRQLGAKAKLANLGEVLCDYRIHPNQESTRNNSRQQRNHLRIVNKFLVGWGISADMQLLPNIIWPSDDLSRCQLKNTSNSIHKTICEIEAADIEDSSLVAAIWDIRLRSLCRRYGYAGWWAYVKARGFKNLTAGKYLGFAFTYSCIKGTN